MNTCTRTFNFDAGHRVPLHHSKCCSPHGHTYQAEVTCKAFKLTEEGFVVDFGIIKDLVGGWIDKHWDHTMLYQKGDSLMETMAKACSDVNGVRPWYRLPCAPTAENMATHLATEAQALLDPHKVIVTRVRIWETPKCHADWVLTEVP